MAGSLVARARAYAEKHVESIELPGVLIPHLRRLSSPADDVALMEQIAIAIDYAYRAGYDAAIEDARRRLRGDK